MKLIFGRAILDEGEAGVVFTWNGVHQLEPLSRVGHSGLAEVAGESGGWEATLGSKNP